VLVDFPDTATFLTPEERSFVIHKKSMLISCNWLRTADMNKEYDNSSVGEEEHFEIRHIIQAFKDWQVWLHILIYMSIIAPRQSSIIFSACGSRTDIYCSLRHNTVLTVSPPDTAHSSLVIPYSLNQYRTIISS